MIKKKVINENEVKGNSQNKSGKMATKTTQGTKGAGNNGGKSGAVLGELNGAEAHKEK
ncbi:hypothetical protein [Halomonas salinarum]|uniref:hypothetical protein n=1 Tax=Halomonas salinarum TaxID=1158993 RepID=UPI00143B0752|nr:hypothetical protein [Halomonas salinarum]